MEFSMGSFVVVCIYSFIVFKMGKSYGYKAARDDLARIGKLADSDS